ncbi:chromosomal replication initiator protein DnaA [Tuwongella immobilis]|uniref:Chromosomal replication initiator protein DnaA n=1 Tax=Tuwongella immobilis TaxID=692036 RepID=A0A6C2YKQ4_9BACT|nr:DnaA/Hda family protein [Tuwongella immobilis]VIP01492.1 chromosomal replication initiator protein : Chromosomal replication initiator protein dnaA OS=uncultured Acidobacteria bacterium A2 PE=3 SV=1: Bac_DnaA: Bac_DnaA_C [Tuwongella immobilis]VTR98568.1 chromosomal replication initiator protein : Chromosomal replication initiator protein dnaA OS=uncultured Acidobacteria bacterium A2 PE=3 SV=1: Bac_DnaA: Bac_DnaA_C [Tuwongella immobilis]
MIAAESRADNRPIPSGVFESDLEAAIIGRVGAARYALWFKNHACMLKTADAVLIGVPSLHFQDWLQQTFGEDVRAAATEVAGGPIAVKFVLHHDLPPIPPIAAMNAGGHPTATTSAPAAMPKANVLPMSLARTQPENVVASAPAITTTASRSGSRKKASPSIPTIDPGEAPSESPKPKPRAKSKSANASNLFHAPSVGHRDSDDAPAADERGRPFRIGRRWRSLSDFVVGPCNRVAHASALSIVEEPGQGPNPLVIHGPVGTGKTHLLEGIYQGLRRNWPEARVLFVTAEEFTNRFVQASRHGKHSSFRKQFRECSALLLDDLNFLATKRATQEEFLHTFDALAADGRQVAVTLDCHPRMNDDLMPELVDRLVGGAVWGVMPPDGETRHAILRSKAAGAMPMIPGEVLEFMASHLRGNVRELEGAVHSVRHFARVTSREIDLSLVREALGELLRHAVRVVQVTDIDSAVCSVLRLPNGSLQSKQRSWTVSHPRMLAIYLARKHTSGTYAEISHHFGGKTHSAAVAAEKKVRQWLTAGESLQLGDRKWQVRELLERIERELNR